MRQGQRRVAGSQRSFDLRARKDDSRSLGAQFAQAAVPCYGSQSQQVIAYNALKQCNALNIQGAHDEKQHGAGRIQNQQD